MISRRDISLGTILALSLPSSVAVAQNANKNAAVAAYDDAERLMAAGKYADACGKYAVSNQLDPQLGVLLHLADCYEKANLLASSWAHFHDAAELAEQRGDPRVQLAKGRAQSIESKLSRLSITVADGSIAGFEVQRDGTVVAPALWGTPLPVDGGQHTIRATAPGKAPWQTTVTIAASGANESVSVPLLANAASAPASIPTPASVSITSPATATTDPRVDAPPTRSTRAILAWSAVGAGAVGIGIGTAFMLKRISKLNERDSICATDDCPGGSQDRVNDLTSQARSATRVGLVGLIAGGAISAGGVALLLTAPKAGAAQVGITPLLDRQFQGVLVRGTVF